MVQLKLKLPTEQLQDTIECIRKANKLQLTQLRVFLHGQEDYYIGLNWIRTRS
jgi:hypothetical protein